MACSLSNVNKLFVINFTHRLLTDAMMILNLVFSGLNDLFLLCIVRFMGGFNPLTPFLGVRRGKLVKLCCDGVIFPPNT